MCLSKLKYPKLTVGDGQHLYFKENDEGPFYLSEDKRSEYKVDFDTGTVQTREKTKREMMEELK